MRILHVIQNLDSTAGGPPRVVTGLSTAQAELGVQSEIVCTKSPGDPQRESIQSGETLSRSIAAEAKNVVVREFPVSVRGMMYSRAMHSWILSEMAKYDLVHVHGLYRFPTSFAAYSARKIGTPYIIRPQGALDPYLYRRSTRSVLAKRVYERMIDLPNLRAASCLHFTTEEERRLTSYLGLQTRTAVVPNGLDWNRYADLPKRGGFRQTYRIPENHLLISFVGRLNFKKGLDLLMPAFARFSVHFPNSCLAIIGPDGGYAEEVSRLIFESGVTEKIILVGELDSRGITQANVDSDIFALTSYSENFGVSVIEAMACKTPVLISDQVNLWDSVVESQSGVVTKCDSAEIESALRSLASDSIKRQALGRNGREYAKSRYSWPSIARQTIDLYESVLKSSSRR